MVPQVGSAACAKACESQCGQSAAGTLQMKQQHLSQKARTVCARSKCLK